MGCIITDIDVHDGLRRDVFYNICALLGLEVTNGKVMDHDCDREFVCNYLLDVAKKSSASPPIISNLLHNILETAGLLPTCRAGAEARCMLAIHAIREGGMENASAGDAPSLLLIAAKRIPEAEKVLHALARSQSLLVRMTSMNNLAVVYYETKRYDEGIVMLEGILEELAEVRRRVKAIVFIQRKFRNFGIQKRRRGEQQKVFDVVLNEECMKRMLIMESHLALMFPRWVAAHNAFEEHHRNLLNRGSGRLVILFYVL
jgi:hypothetical protein